MIIFSLFNTSPGPVLSLSNLSTLLLTMQAKLFRFAFFFEIPFSFFALHLQDSPSPAFSRFRENPLEASYHHLFLGIFIYRGFSRCNSRSLWPWTPKRFVEIFPSFFSPFFGDLKRLRFFSFLFR